MKFSIIICTYNRADVLKITLPSYYGLIIPEDIYLQIIVVNNNSHDETECYLKEFINKNTSAIQIDYVFEKKQGLSHARNTGYKNAYGDYIAYLDDECLLPNHWLEIALEIIQSGTPAFLGGPYFGKYIPGYTSEWFKESFGDSYLLKYNLPNGPIDGYFLSGGNMLVRRDVFKKVGLFNTSLGMKGGVLHYGEEQDFQRRLIAKFPDEHIFYNSNLFVWHLIRNEKMSIKYCFKEALIRGASQAKLIQNPSKKLLWLSPLSLLYSLVKAGFSATLLLIQSFYSQEHYYTLLHRDYENRIWKDIGLAWYRGKKLLSEVKDMLSRVR